MKAALHGQSSLALVLGNVGVKTSGHEKQTDFELSIFSSTVQSILPIHVDCFKLRTSVNEEPGHSNYCVQGEYSDLEFWR